jgi:hypothetical protein
MGPWVPASRRHLFDSVTLFKRNVVEFDRLVQSKLVTILRHIRHVELFHDIFDNTRLLSKLASVKAIDLNFLTLVHSIGSLEPPNRILRIVDITPHFLLSFRLVQ